MTFVEKLIAICDATCIIPDAHMPGRARRGKASCGYLFLNGEKRLDCKIGQGGRYLGEMTVPEAEYNGLITALDEASGHCRNDIEVWMDNELVVRHLTRTYRLKAPNLKPLFDKVKTLEGRFRSVSYFHHSRDSEMARLADRVAQAYLQVAVK